jgi:penicillin V acylase-like amidase (Ntn superfamily)
MRWLLDTCDSADQARQALLAVKQYYFMAPCHYIVADRAGDSFVYENSTGTRRGADTPTRGLVNGNAESLSAGQIDPSVDASQHLGHLESTD